MNYDFKLLKNKISLITGCNSGIGKSILEIFAQNNCNIIACVRKSDSDFTELIKNLSSKYNINIDILNFDLEDINSIKNALSFITKNKISIDILVNNAGAIDTALFQMTSLKNLKKMFEINYFGPFYLTQFVSKNMIKNKKGNIVNISTSAAIEMNVGRTAYSSSKSAFMSACSTMSKELSNFNIRVNTIAPGLTDTKLMRESTKDEAINKTIERISLKRIGTPEEIAKVALFLASDMSSYITGQIIKVDGGLREE